MKPKNISPRNENGNRHGYWERYWGDGYLYHKGFFNNGEQIGYEEKYRTFIKKLSNKSFYI